MTKQDKHSSDTVKAEEVKVQQGKYNNRNDGIELGCNKNAEVIWVCAHLDTTPALTHFSF